MFYTSSDLFEPKVNNKLTEQLNLQLNNINHKMIELKKEWANSYMLANEVSKQAFIHRFVKLSNTQGRQSGDGEADKKDYFTAEELGVQYKVSPIAKIKVDTLFREYTTREFNCSVKSIPNDEWKLITKYFIDETFNSNQFNVAHRFAIKDGLVKGTGFLRTKIYDLTVDVKSPVINKSGKKLIDFKIVKKTIKQGLEVEYIDCENVYIDPNAKNPKELFISTVYTDLEVVNLYPKIKPYINFDNKLTGTNDKDKFIKSQYISHYKIGERLVEWYKKPEMSLTKLSGSYNEQSINIGLDADNLSDFNNNWSDNIFGGIQFNDYYEVATQQSNMYRVNEYYNWADLENPRYVLYIDNVVLYDGPILEPFQDCPIVPLYFERPKESIFGRGVPAVLYNSLLNLNEVATDIAELTKMAKANMIEVNEDRLIDSNVPIDIEPNGLTIVRTRSASQDGSIANTPAVMPISIPVPGLELTVQLEQKYKGDIETIIPNSEPSSINMPKEEREQSIRSRMLVVNEMLNINKLQLNLLAYRVFASKMFELQYFGEPLGIKTEVTNRLLIVKDTGKQLAETKVIIVKKLKEQYDLQIQLTIQQLMQDEAFNKQLDTVKAQLQEKYTQMADSIKQSPEMANNQNTEGDNQKAVVETAQAQYTKELEGYIMSVAQQQVPKPVDNAIYLAMEEIDDLISIQKEFNFSFSKSREEQQIAINQFLSFVGQLPLSGQALSYDDIVKEALIAFGMNPLIKLADVPPTNKMMANAQTRHTDFFDWSNFPSGQDQFVRNVHGIDLPDGTALKDLANVQQIKDSGQVAKDQAKITAQGQVDVSKAGFNAQLANQGLKV